MRRVVLLAFIWGWSFLFIKVAVEGMTPSTVGAARITLGFLALVVIGRRSGVRLPRDRAYWRSVIFAGVFGCAVPFTLLAWGEERITSALTSVAQGTTSMFTALFAAVLLNERLRSAQILGLIGGLVGVGVAAGLGADDLSGASLAGVAAAVLAGASYGFTYAHNERHLLHVSPMTAATGQLLVGAVVLAPFAVVTTATNGIELTPARVGAILALGVVGTGIAYWINFGALASVGATATSLVTYMIPPIAVVVGWVVLDEEITPRLLVGLVIIVASVAVVRARPRRKRAPAEAAAVGYTSSP
jgi:drug/metabolite transporter (DMT)-like permease